jgi:hypothetical protein
MISLRCRKKFGIPMFATISSFSTSLCENPVRFSTAEQKYFDLIVLGGGSGGLACAKRAAGLMYHLISLDVILLC